MGASAEIQLSELERGRGIPWLVEPMAAGGQELAPFVRERRAWLREALLLHGALLFRGFGIDSAERFEAFLDAAELPLMDYPRGTSPRTAVRGRIYTSTETAPHHPIPLHTEMSYTSVFPQAIAFCCLEPAPARGETPIADMMGVLARLPEAVVRPFEERGLRYTQIVPEQPTPFSERTWSGMFATEERGEVEQICRSQGLDCSWLADGALRIQGTCPAIRLHPRSGAPVWFNQAHVFHGTMSAEFEHQGLAEAAVAVRKHEALRRRDPAMRAAHPYDCTYGDGGDIPDDAMAEVRRAQWAEEVLFPWQRGDLLLLDNFRVGHGRRPFTGERRLLAALIERVW